MPYIEARRNGSGSITSYRIVVSTGYDDYGKQIRHRFLWTPPKPDMSEKQMEKEATAAAYKYEEQINNGFLIDQHETFSQYAQYVLDLKEKTGVRASTIDRYIDLLVRINQAIGSLELTKIRPQHLNALYSDLKENGVRADTDQAVATRALKTTLHEMEISKAKLSRMAGVAASTITNVTRGDPIRIDKAEAIAAALECDFAKAKAADVRAGVFAGRSAKPKKKRA